MHDVIGEKIFFSALFQISLCIILKLCFFPQLKNKSILWKQLVRDQRQLLHVTVETVNLSSNMHSAIHTNLL